MLSIGIAPTFCITSIAANKGICLAYLYINLKTGNMNDKNAKLPAIHFYILKHERNLCFT